MFERMDIPVKAEQHHDGVSDLWLYPVFTSRADYEAQTGKSCPAYHPNIGPKYWYDPDAHQRANGNPTVSYPVISCNMQTGLVQVNDQGHVVMGELTLLVNIAAGVNIPLDPRPKDAACRVPVRELKPNEYIEHVNGILTLKSIQAKEVPHDELVRLLKEIQAQNREILSQLQLTATVNMPASTVLPAPVMHPGSGKHSRKTAPLSAGMGQPLSPPEDLR